MLYCTKIQLLAHPIAMLVGGGYGANRRLDALNGLFRWRSIQSVGAGRRRLSALPLGLASPGLTCNPAELQELLQEPSPRDLRKSSNHAGWRAFFDRAPATRTKRSEKSRAWRRRRKTAASHGGRRFAFEAPASGNVLADPTGFHRAPASFAARHCGEPVVELKRMTARTRRHVMPLRSRRPIEAPTSAVFQRKNEVFDGVADGDLPMHRGAPRATENRTGNRVGNMRTFARSRFGSPPILGSEKAPQEAVAGLD